MRIATAWSTIKDTETAVRIAYSELQNDLGAAPNLLILYTTVEHPSQRLVEILPQVCPGVPVHGVTSCQGVMTADGFHSAAGVALGMWGISDPGCSQGHFGRTSIGQQSSRPWRSGHPH